MATVGMKGLRYPSFPFAAGVKREEGNKDIQSACVIVVDTDC